MSHYLQATLSMSPHFPAKQPEKVSQVDPTVHGSPSGTIAGQLPIARLPSGFCVVGAKPPPKSQDPTRHRTASLQGCPGSAQVIATHCPDGEQPKRAGSPLVAHGPEGTQPKEVSHSTSDKQEAPAPPLLQIAAPARPTHPSGATQPPGSPGSPAPSPQGAPMPPSGAQRPVCAAQ